MTEIQQNRWDQLIRRASNIVGGGSQVNDTLNELFPTIDVENVPIELLALSGTTVAVAGSLLTASALDINKHQLFNPVGSNSMLVVTTMLLRSNTAGNARIAISATALTDAVGNEIRRDTRRGVAARVVGQNRSLQSAAGISAHFLVTLEAAVLLTVNDQNGLFVLFPGTGVTFAGPVVNVATACTFLWRERVIEPAEDNF